MFPTWKRTFIRLNRELYRDNRKWIDKWLPKVRPLPASWQKLEWNCKGEKRDIWKYVLQFRASGVRVKRPTTAPSLIAMTTTQVPIIAWDRRYMTPRECARLQSLNELDHLPEIETRAFKALGNAVNADVVELIAQALIQKPPSSRSVHHRSQRVPRRATREALVHAHA
jgi:DNA (cytosine-5)-methyltransferase 1